MATWWAASAGQTSCLAVFATAPSPVVRAGLGAGGGLRAAVERLEEP